MINDFGRHVWWGVRAGLGWGASLSVWVTIVLAVHGPAAFAKQHTTYASVVALYLGGGLVAGAIVGALKPLARFDAGVPVVGICAAFPVVIGLRFATQGFGPWRQNDTVLTVFATLLFGLGGALAILRIRDANGPRSSRPSRHKR